jgi:NAD(P)-dependent dehydrogenase (short-subunit alcohol dehydrogenase family)
MLLTDRVAIVTGGAKGIGRGIALKFADEGCSVAIADINMEAANDTLSQIRKKGRDGLAVQCNAAEGKQVRDMVAQVISKFGKIDILVNNAGGLPSVYPIEEMPDEEWDKAIALNMRSGFLFCKAVIPHMKAKKYGKIINISSLGAISPPASNVHYHSGKAGVLGLTTDMAVYLASSNICVNAIVPGPIRTDFYGARAKDDAFFANLGKTVPLGRVGTADDIGGAALFFASELSSFITGEALKVAGGLPLSPARRP